MTSHNATVPLGRRARLELHAEHNRHHQGMLGWGADIRLRLTGSGRSWRAGLFYGEPPGKGWGHWRTRRGTVSGHNFRVGRRGTNQVWTLVLGRSDPAAEWW